MSMDIIQLAHQVKEVRDLQKAYFESRNGRYADRKLLDAAKLSEKSLDAIVAFILASPDPSNIGIFKDGIQKSLQPARLLKEGDEFRFLGKKKVFKAKIVTPITGHPTRPDEILIIVYPKCRQILLPPDFEIVIIRTIPLENHEIEF